MTCKDCIHYEICTFGSIINKNMEKDCKRFKNKADVVEVKYGEWIEDGYFDIPCSCSYCGSEAPYKVISCQDKYDFNYYDELVFVGTEIKKEYIQTPYCPICGAKMKKREGTKTALEIIEHNKKVDTRKEDEKNV